MDDDALRSAHDRFVKFAFSDTRNSRELFTRILPAQVIPHLNLETLTLVPGSFVDTELRERFTDLLYRVSFRNGDGGFVYILFDHKSSPDLLLPFKLLRYMVKIWEQQLRNNTRLSPIVPLILYHGEHAWNTSRTMQDIVKAPEDLECYVPHFDSVLVDLSQYSDSDLRENALYNAVLQVLKYISRDELTERLPGILQLFVQIVDEPHGMDCLRAVLVYLSNATDKLSREQLSEALHQAFITVKSVNTESDSPMPTIAEQWIQEGIEKGMEKGMEKGREIGLRAGISVVLELRFPNETSTVTEHISALHSPELLTEFLDLCKSASSLNELQAFLDRVRHD